MLILVHRVCKINELRRDVFDYFEGYFWREIILEKNVSLGLPLAYIKLIFVILVLGMGNFYSAIVYTWAI